MSKEENKKESKITKLRIAVGAVDVVLFSIIEGHLCVFLIPIHRPPYYVNLRGLPGGLIKFNETADESALRNLKEKANISGVHIEQLYTFTKPDRDKRSRAISVAYMALISANDFSTKKQNEGEWINVKNLPKLAFDHKEIIKVAIDRLKGKLTYTNIVSNLLPKYFTLAELQIVNEIILDEKLDKRNFRKKILSSGILKVSDKQKQTTKRPAQLYSF